MKLAIIGMGIMGCRYAQMISSGLIKGIELSAVTRITPERKEALFVEGAEGSKSLILANAMYLSSWIQKMVKLPTTIEEECTFELAYETEFMKKQSACEEN